MTTHQVKELQLGDQMYFILALSKLFSGAKTEVKFTQNTRAILLGSFRKKKMPLTVKVI